MHLPQVLPIHVGVDLRGGDVHVPEHLLHGTEVGAPLQQVRGERVSERVGRHVLGDPRALDVAAQDLPGTMRVRGLPRAFRNSTPFPSPFSSLGRSSRR